MAKAREKYQAHLGKKPGLDASRETRQRWSQINASAHKWLTGK